MFRLYYGRGITLVSLCSVYLCWRRASVVRSSLGPRLLANKNKTSAYAPTVFYRYYSSDIDRRIDRVGAAARPTAVLRQCPSPGVITLFINATFTGYSITTHCWMQKVVLSHSPISAQRLMEWLFITL